MAPEQEGMVQFELFLLIYEADNNQDIHTNLISLATFFFKILFLVAQS